MKESQKVNHWVRSPEKGCRVIFGSFTYVLEWAIGGINVDSFLLKCSEAIEEAGCSEDALSPEDELEGSPLDSVELANLTVCLEASSLLCKSDLVGNVVFSSSESLDSEITVIALTDLFVGAPVKL